MTGSQSIKRPGKQKETQTTGSKVTGTADRVSGGSQMLKASFVD